MRPKVLVDKPPYPRDLSRFGSKFQALRMTVMRPLTGGGLLRSIMPRPSTSILAPRYWLHTRSRVWRKTSRNFRIRP